MATYYVDPAAGGANDGSSWTDAWTDIQSAYDTAGAGDTVYCRGTQTLAAKIDIDTNSGNTTNGFIKFIGCNGSGVVDGTRFILDGNSTAASCIEATSSKSYIWHENFEFKNATGIGCSQSSILNYNWVWINCASRDHGSHGWDDFDYHHWIRCVAYGNGGSGFYRPTAAHMYFCRSRNNTSYGLDQYSGELDTICIGCIFDNNGNTGVNYPGGRGIFFNCVIDANASNGFVLSTAAGNLTALIGCRVTNHDTAGEKGVNASNKPLLEGWNYFQNNDGNNIQNTNLTYNIPYDGSSSDLEDQGDTESGYTDEDDPEDYTLVSDATLRRTAIDIPVS